MSVVNDAGTRLTRYLDKPPRFIFTTRKNVRRSFFADEGPLKQQLHTNGSLNLLLPFLFSVPEYYSEYNIKSNNIKSTITK